ncbi:MAG: hypothetical protein U0Q22_09715 [Acidimicrobiales bacterium]
MTARHSLIIGVILILGCTTAACGNSNDAAKSSSSTTAATTTTATGSGSGATTPDSTTTTVHDPKAFEDTLAAMNKELTDAGDTFCGIVLAGANSTRQAGKATTPDEVHRLYDFYAAIFTKIADTMPTDTSQGAADSKLIRSAVDKMQADIKAAGYDPASLPVGGPPAAFATPDLTAALSRLTETMSTKCTNTGASKG